MKCPHCQTENEQNSIFCKNCNAWILDSIYHDENEDHLSEECDHDPEVPKRKKWLIPALAGIALAVIGVVIALLLQPGTPETPVIPIERNEGYVYAKDHIRLQPLVNGSRVIFNDRMVVDLDGFSYSKHTSLDGSTAIYLQSDHKLVLVQNGSSRTVTEDALTCTLSTSGNVVAYANDRGLYLYHVDTLQHTQIADTPQVYSIALSPNGESVLCFVRTSPNDSDYSGVLLCFRNGERTALGQFENPPQLLAVPDSGSFCYISRSDLASGNENLCSVFPNGSTISIKLSSKDLTSSYMDLEQYCYFNADQTQLLYHLDGCTYISENGQAGVCIADEVLTPARPTGTTLTAEWLLRYLPNRNFYSSVFVRTYRASARPDISTTSAYFDLYRLSDTNDLSVILEHARKYLLSRDGTEIYCIASTDELYRFQYHEDGSVPRSMLAQNVTDFALSADVLYYSTGSELYACPVSGGDGTLLATGKRFSKLTVNQGGYLFCVHDATGYELTKDAEGQVCILNPGTEFSAAPNGLIYIEKDSELYVSIDTLALTPIQ